MKQQKYKSNLKSLLNQDIKEKTYSFSFKSKKKNNSELPLISMETTTQENQAKTILTTRTNSQKIQSFYGKSPLISTMETHRKTKSNNLCLTGKNFSNRDLENNKHYNKIKNNNENTIKLANNNELEDSNDNIHFYSQIELFYKEELYFQLKSHKMLEKYKFECKFYIEKDFATIKKSKSKEEKVDYNLFFQNDLNKNDKIIECLHCLLHLFLKAIKDFKSGNKRFLELIDEMINFVNHTNLINLKLVIYEFAIKIFKLIPNYSKFKVN